MQLFVYGERGEAAKAFFYCLGIVVTFLVFYKYNHSMREIKVADGIKLFKQEE